MTEAEGRILASAITNITTIAANNDLLEDIDVPAGVAPADDGIPAIVGVSEDLKAAKPVAPVTTEEKRKALVLAVNKAAIEGEHVILAELAKSILGTVSGFKGLAGFFA